MASTPSYFSGSRVKRNLSRNSLKYISGASFAVGGLKYLGYAGLSVLPALAAPILLGVSAVGAVLSHYRTKNKRKLLKHYLSGRSSLDTDIYVKGKDLMKIEGFEDLDLFKHHLYKIELNENNFKVVDEKYHLEFERDYPEKDTNNKSINDSLEKIIKENSGKIAAIGIHGKEYEDAKNRLPTIGAYLATVDINNDFWGPIRMIPSFYTDLKKIEKYADNFGDPSKKQIAQQMINDIMNKIDQAIAKPITLDDSVKATIDPMYDTLTPDEQKKAVFKFAKLVSNLLQEYVKMNNEFVDNIGDKQKINNLLNKIVNIN